MFRLPFVLGVIATTLLSGCGLFKDCKREGCEAVIVRVPDEDGHTGFAGRVAAPSDTVENGCQNCPFASTTLEIGKVSVPVTDALSARVALAETTIETITTDGQYTREAEPGNYVVCRGTACIAVEVVQYHWTTINVLLGQGPAAFILFDPRTGQRTSAPMFELTK